MAIWAELTGPTTNPSARTGGQRLVGWPADRVPGTRRDPSSPSRRARLDGRATALWGDITASPNTIGVAVRSVSPSFAAATFGTPGTASQPGVQTSNPEIAVDQNNFAVAAWSASDATSSFVQTATRPSGGSFGSYRTVSGTGASAFSPKVAMDGAGNTAVIWQGFSGSQSAIQAAFRPRNGDFEDTDDLDVLDSSSGIQSPPNLAFDAGQRRGHLDPIGLRRASSTTTYKLRPPASMPSGRS